MRKQSDYAKGGKRLLAAVYIGERIDSNFRDESVETGKFLSEKVEMSFSKIWLNLPKCKILTIKMPRNITQILKDDIERDRELS